MTDEIAIQVDHLSKVYKLYNSPLDRLKESLHPLRKKYHQDFNALHDVSFEIKKGESVGIIGKNGSGKSTLLKLVTGVLTPTSGCVTVVGRISALLELGSGFNPELTGMENVYFNGTLMGYSRAEMDSRLDSILSFAGIGNFIHQPVKSYSSGMFVRLAFSVAISVDPEILIIDEALSVGDMFFQAKCMAALERFRNNGCTLLFVSHSIDTIKSLCQRAIHISNGKVAGIGEASAITDTYIRQIREEGKHVSGALDMAAPLNWHFKSAPIPFTNDDKDFRVDPALDNLDCKLRYGSGEVRFKSVELLNENNDPVVRADFNAMVKIKLCIECYQSCKISVNYHIRDAYNINTIGSDLLMESNQLIDVSPHEKYIVEFETRLPLSAGNYSLLTSITEQIIVNKDARFVDVIEVARVFSVLERTGARLWSKVYVDNVLNVFKVGCGGSGSIEGQNSSVARQTLRENSPAFLIIGAQKCGTTALHHYLAKHTDLSAPQEKELDFFSCCERYGKGIDYYHSFFATCNPAKQLFEASPSYLQTPEAPQRIYHYNPSIKLIAILRDPVERAYSAWNMYVKYFRKNPDWFADWMKRCDSQYSQRSVVKRSEKSLSSFMTYIQEELESNEKGEYIEAQILSHGYYHPQLIRYLELFGSQQLLVLSSENLKNCTISTLVSVEEFLCVNHHEFSEEDLTPVWCGDYLTKPPVEAQILLTEHYRQSNNDLFTDFGISFR